MRLFGFDITFGITRAQADRAGTHFEQSLRDDASAVNRVVVNAEHDVVDAVRSAAHTGAEAVRSVEHAAVDDIVRVKQYLRSISAKATVSNDALRVIKGGILSTTTQLVAALTAVADQVAKFPDALKARDDAIAARDARIQQLEAALLTAKATSTDSPEIDSILASLTAVTTAAAAAAATLPAPLTPAAADNVPPVLTTPVSAAPAASA